MQETLLDYQCIWFVWLLVTEKKTLWPELSSILECGVEAWCLGGDFNVTRMADERPPIGRNTRGMRLFNNFIDSANIMELPLQNGRFTWSREGGLASRSLLDRFFIYNKWEEVFENRVSGKA